MSRYFFDQNDSGLPRDNAGLEIDDPHELRREALRTATYSLSMRPIGESRSATAVTVRDEYGAVHMIVRVSCERPEA